MSSNTGAIALGGAAVLGVVLLFFAGAAFAWTFIFMLIHGAIVGHGLGAGYWTQPWGFWTAAPWGFLGAAFLRPTVSTN
jgi:hypothetical protein